MDNNKVIPASPTSLLAYVDCFDSIIHFEWVPVKEKQESEVTECR